MDFDKEYKLYKIGLSKKISKRYEEKAAGNRTEDLDLIDDSQCETEIKRLLKTIDKSKRWKVTSNDWKGPFIARRIAFTCPEWNLTTASKNNDKLYATVLVLSKDALQKAINKHSERFKYPNTEHKEQADVNIPYFLEKNECEWFFYTLVRSMSSRIFGGDYAGQLALMEEMYSEDEIKALSSQEHLIVNSKDSIDYFRISGNPIGYCYRLSVSNLFLSLRMVASAAIRKVEEIRHLDNYPKVNETLSSIGLAGRVQKKYEKRDAIEEISYANYKKVVKNLICCYSRAHYADLIDSMKSTNDLIFKHMQSTGKDQGSGVFVRGKNELWLCLGEYGTILNITSKHLEVLRGSILMANFLHGTLKAKDNFINNIIDDYSDFVVSVIRAGHEEIVDFLEFVSRKVEEYDYLTIKDIFSELNESVTSLGLGKRVISKDKERNKNKADALYDMSSIDSVMECLKTFLNANGYKEVKDVFMAYEKKSYDILDMMETSDTSSNEERSVVFAIGLGETDFKVKDHMPAIWQLNLYDRGTSVVMTLNSATKATPEMVIGPKDESLWYFGWLATPDRILNVVTFCASYDDSKPLEEQQDLMPYKFNLQESANLGLNKKVSSKFKSEATPNSVRDLDETIDEEIDGSKDFLSVLLREAKKIGMLPKGRYEALEPMPRDSSEGQFVFNSYKLYSQKEDGNWTVDPVCNVTGYIKEYWPIKLYSSAEIYTMAGEGWHCGDDNFFVIRIVFGRVGGAPYRWIDHIEYGKASQKSGYNPKDFGPLAVADLDKIFSTKVDRDENDCIALTKTNAILILDLMKSFMRHKKDQVNIKVKTLGWHVDNAGHWIKDEKPHYETQEVPLWDYLSRLRTKKSNKAFCLAVSNNCWKKDFKH